MVIAANFNSQKVEATGVFINKKVNKQNVAYAYNGVLFSLKKAGNTVPCYTSGHCAE